MEFLYLYIRRYVSTISLSYGCCGAYSLRHLCPCQPQGSIIHHHIHTTVGLPPPPSPYLIPYYDPRVRYYSSNQTMQQTHPTTTSLANVGCDQPHQLALALPNYFQFPPQGYLPGIIPLEPVYRTPAYQSSILYLVPGYPTPSYCHGVQPVGATHNPPQAPQFQQSFHPQYHPAQGLIAAIYPTQQYSSFPQASTNTLAPDGYTDRTEFRAGNEVTRPELITLQTDVAEFSGEMTRLREVVCHRCRR